MIGFTCGSFDLLHAGHVLMLQEARAQCDRLVVGLQSDPTLDRPGKNKPVQTLEERQIILGAVRYVDEVVVYDTESDLHALLATLHQEHGADLVRFIGADWKGRCYTGHDLPMRVVFNSRDHGYSTSELRARVATAELAAQERCCSDVCGRTVAC